MQSINQEHLVFSKNPLASQRSNKLQARTAVNLILKAAIFIILVICNSAFSATITVNTTVAGIFLFDGKCSLREAIVSTNTNEDYAGCTHTGTYDVNDTIILPPETYEIAHPPCSAPPSICQWHTAKFNSMDILGELTIKGSTEGQSSLKFVGIRPRPIFIIRKHNVTIENIVSHANVPLILAEEGGNSSTILENVLIENNAPYSNTAIAVENTPIITLENASPVFIKDSTIRNNNVYRSIYNIGSLTIINSTISNNGFTDITNPKNGAGIFNEGSLHIINSTLSNNKTFGIGAGIYNDGGDVLLENVTITKNEASEGAGVASDGGSFRVKNSIIAGNSIHDAFDSSHQDCLGSFTSEHHNLIGVVNGCNGFDFPHDLIGSASNPLNPGLGVLTFNGGSAATHALNQESPAIDAGTLKSSSDCLDKDQRGEPRGEDGDGDGLLECDIGAYEAPSIPIQADLSVEVTASSNAVDFDDELSFSVKLNNHSQTVAVNDVVLDMAFSGGSFVSASSGCSPSGVKVICNVSSISKNSSETLTGTFKATTLGYISVFPEVSSSANDIDVDNDFTHLSVAVNPVADLSLIHSAPSLVTLDTEFAYTLTVTNNGPQIAEEVLLQSFLPQNIDLQYLDFSADKNGVNCTFAPVASFANRVACTLGNMANGEVITIGLHVEAPPKVLDFESEAVVSSKTGDNYMANNNRKAATSSKVPKKVGADLRVGIDAPATVKTGETFSYTLVLSNDGPDAAKSIELLIALPEGVTIKQIRTKDETFNQCEEGKTPNTFVCDLGNMNARTSKRFSFEVIAPKSATTLNTVLNASTSRSANIFPDPDETNNAAEATTTVVAPFTDLRVNQILGPKDLQLGSSAQYSIFLENVGDVAAVTTTLQLNLPSELSFVEVEGASCSLERSTNDLSCTLGAFAATTVREVNLFVKAVKSGEASLIAKLTSNTADPEPDNNQFGLGLDISQGETDIAINLSAPGNVTIGETFAYQLELGVNEGSFTADVELSTTLAEGLTLLEVKALDSAPNTCSTSGRTVKCNYEQVQSDDIREVVIKVKAPSTPDYLLQALPK